MHFLFKRHTLTPTEKHSLQSFHSFLQTSPSCCDSNSFLLADFTLVLRFKKQPQHAFHHFQILSF